MEYRVVLADSAKADAESLYQWVIEKAPLRGPEWFEKLLDCLYSLNHSPARCPLAPESKRSHREIRNLLYGKRRNVYRILFEISTVTSASLNTLRSLSVIAAMLQIIAQSRGVPLLDPGIARDRRLLFVPLFVP